MDPSSWGDTIGLVLELALIEVVEFLENCLLKKLRVKSCNTVDGVRADNGKISHSNLLWPSLLNKTHPLNLLVITWILLLQLTNVQMVDLVDNLQVSWQQSANEINRPLLKSLWQDSVIGVREGMVSNIPCFLKAQLFFINQDSEQLDGGDGWMRVIQLDFVFLGEKSESIVVSLLISADHIIDGGGAEEVLLLETELFTRVGAVVGVENTCNVLSILSFSYGSMIIRGVEF